jgi:phage portal protein BeeE
MRNLLSRFRRPAEAKASRAGAAIAVYVTGRPLCTPRDYAALAREGFQKNPVVHRAVRLVAEAAAALPLSLVEGGRMLERHPLLALLRRPNPREGGARFLESVYGHLLVAGNAYLEAVAVEGSPRELYALRPDRMRVVPGPDGWPAAYEYAVGAETVRFAQTGETPPILHLTLFHPTDDHYGLSPMEAAAVPLDIHNAAGSWNKALLDNAARPCGALVLANGAPGMSEAQFARLKEELETNYQGAANGRAPAPARGRARLEAAVADAEGHGFRRGEECGGARDRARLRRAAAALGPARRQHPCQLRRGEPRLLPADGDPAREAHRRSDRAVAPWRRTAAAYACAASSTSPSPAPARSTR